MPTDSPSLPLRVVVGAVLVEGVLYLGVTAFFIAEIVFGRPADVLAATVIAALAGLVAGFLLLCARALWWRRRWARGPVMAWQLIQLLTAVTTTFSELWMVIALATVSLVAGVGLLLPRVVAETTVPADPPVI